MIRTALPLLLLFATSLVGSDAPYLVKDFPGRKAGSSLRGDAFWATIGDSTYFSADPLGSEALNEDLVKGRNVWKTDGTPEGTVQVTNVMPQLQGHAQVFLGVLDGKLVYYGANGSDGGIYVIDTNAAVLPALPPRIALHYPFGGGLVHGGFIYYVVLRSGSTRVARTDGTTAGTTILDLNPAPSWTSQLISLGDSLYYLGESASGKGLHRWDGVSSTSTLVFANPTGQRANSLRKLAGRLYFETYVTDSVETSNATVWVSDGTQQGTTVVREGKVVSAEVAVDDTVVVRVTPESGPIQFWSSTGTSSRFLGDVAVTVTREHSIAQGPIVGRKYFFFTHLEHEEPFRLFSVDLDGGGVTELATSESLYTPSFFVWNDRFYFQRGDEGGSEWWTSDGTASGTRAFTSLFDHRAAGVQSVLPHVRPDGVLFSAYGLYTGGEPWFFDGTSGDMRMLKNIAYDGIHGSNPTNLQANGDTLFFLTAPPEGRHVAVSDGTSAGTSLRDPILTTPVGVAVGSRYFYVEPRGFYVNHPRADRLMVTHAKSRETTALAADVETIVPLRDGVAFLDASGWLGFSDGTVAGTRTVTKIDPGTRLFSTGDSVWFGFREAVYGTDLLSTPTEVAAEEFDGTLRGAAEMGDTVYLLAQRESGVSLWRSDRTRGGTWRVTTVETPINSSYVVPFVASPTQLFALTQKLLIRSDGTESGTVALPFADESFKNQSSCSPSLFPLRGGVAA
ncbi:MAG TPA: hypothetical protein VFV49_07715, partial [Thermoanaerobaculia bacterium]|nr:hypothetical protein [Thermoanaerobaculia bacterium]